MVKQSPYRVWFVDDEADERFFIEHALKGMGDAVRFRSFQNGPELQHALETVELEERPHLIMCDREMPQMDGIEVVQWLRESRWSFLRCLILSNSPAAEHKSHARSAGADDYYVKPAKTSELAAHVQEIVMEWQKRTTWMHLPTRKPISPAGAATESHAVTAGAH